VSRTADGRTLAGFLAGDSEAVARFDAWILPVIRHRAWSLPAQQEDLLQEVRLRLLRGLSDGAFQGRSGLRHYVQRVTQYTCLDAVRRARVRRAEDLDAEPLVDPCDDPLEELSRRESARLGRWVLARLSERCRRLLLLLLEEELGYGEVARRLGLRVGTVKSRVARCRDRAVALRAELRAGERPARDVVGEEEPWT
jgi:RNA polymerase sigma-70 factor (ECF subfamily)